MKPTSFIDVRQLIGELSDKDLLESADAYFAGLQPTSEQCRKPFSNASDAPHLTRHLGLVLQAADLFAGAEVLDFGCATGWLTHGLASIGCRVVGVDVSPAALRLADHCKHQPYPPSGAAEFRCYDGYRLPLEDASMDRIICFDAFHHVRDQAATLREFARVLREGGRIAMMEPGPHHSSTEQSQEEMRRYNVIENDIRMEEIARYSAAAGLDEPRMLVQFQVPMELDIIEFQSWARSGIPLVRGTRILHRLASQLTNAQCFYLTKGSAVPDSREASTLRGEIRLLERRVGTATSPHRLVFAVRNTGMGTWRAGLGGSHGTVKLGCQLLDSGGALVNMDYSRFDLPGANVAIGAEVQVPVELGSPVPEGSILRFDLVSEHVAWFGGIGASMPVDIPLSNLRR